MNRTTKASPKKFQPDLVDTGRPRSNDLAESRIRHVTDRNVPLGVVPRIERLESELEAHLLANSEVLEQPCVPVVKARCIQNAAAGVAEEPRCRLLKSLSVEPLGNSWADARVCIPNEIGPVCAKGVVEAPDIGAGDGHGESRLERYDARSWC